MTQREKNCSLWQQQVFQEQQKFTYRLKGMQEVEFSLVYSTLEFCGFGFWFSNEHIGLRGNRSLSCVLNGLISFLRPKIFKINSNNFDEVYRAVHLIYYRQIEFKRAITVRQDTLVSFCNFFCQQDDVAEPLRLCCTTQVSKFKTFTSKTFLSSLLKKIHNIIPQAFRTVIIKTYLKYRIIITNYIRLPHLK